MSDRAAEARLRFAVRGGRTVLVESRAEAPLAVRGPLAGGDGAECGAAVLVTGGGLLAADSLHITIHTERDARAVLSTVGATRLLPTAAMCSQELALHLGRDCALTYMPDPLIPCRDAAFRQRVTVDLDPGATVILGEVIAPGRLAHGERFDYRSLDLRLRVECAGRPLLIDRLLLEPAAGHLQALLGPYTHLATLQILGPSATAGLAARLHGLFPAQDMIGGASRPAEGVLLVRVLGCNAHALHTVLGRIAVLARSTLA